MSRIHSPIHREKRRKRTIRLSILAVILVLMIIGGSIYWLRSDRFVIASVNVSGASFSDPQQIQTAAMRDISGNYLFVYPKASTFFYSAKKIETDILQNFPAVQSLTVALQKNTAPIRPSLDVVIKERTPAILWCGNVISDSSSSPSQCYFADASGLIFSEAPHFSGTLYPIFYGGLGEASTTYMAATTTAIIGNSILTPSKLAGLLAFAKSVQPIGFDVASYQINEDPSGDLCDLYYGTSTSSYLQVDCDASADAGGFPEMAKNLGIFISDPHFSTSTPAGYQYIDLRFGDKIVYKRK